MSLDARVLRPEQPSFPPLQKRLFSGILTQHMTPFRKKKPVIDEETHEEFHRGLLSTVGLFFLELIKVVVLAGITIGLVRYFLFKPFYVKGESMEPSFKAKEYLIIDELSYRFREPTRGEVIVFRAPVLQKDYYLKRVIALPGERIRIQDGKVVIYNEEHPQGVVIDETYLVEETPGQVNYTLGPDEYFVLGDNRDASFDSRRFGLIQRSAIVGRTWVRGWPFNRVQFIDTPSFDI
jgi:signal peptidase I